MGDRFRPSACTFVPYTQFGGSENNLKLESSYLRRLAVNEASAGRRDAVDVTLQVSDPVDGGLKDQLDLGELVGLVEARLSERGYDAGGRGTW